MAYHYIEVSVYLSLPLGTTHAITSRQGHLVSHVEREYFHARAGVAEPRKFGPHWCYHDNPVFETNAAWILALSPYPDACRDSSTVGGRLPASRDLAMSTSAVDISNTTAHMSRNVSAVDCSYCVEPTLAVRFDPHVVWHVGKVVYIYYPPEVIFSLSSISFANACFRRWPASNIIGGSSVQSTVWKFQLDRLSPSL